jgi:hypothetical protein
MDRREARLALQFAGQWAREGLLPPASLGTLQARYAADAREDPEGESFGSGVLYGLGGILVGAAAFALLVLLQENHVIADLREVAPWFLFVWGLACTTAAFALDLVARKPRLADAFHVAALLAVTASGFVRPDELPFGLLAMPFAAALIWYRRTRFLVPSLALIALNAALASVLFGYVARSSDESAAFGLWFGYAVGQLPVLVAGSRLAKWPWPSFGVSGATLLLAGSFLGWYFDVVDDVLPGFDGDAEVYVAFLMAICLVAGFLLREKGMVLAAALVVAIDSIVFAFDVGEIVGGLIAILAVAGLLLWQAGSLRRYLRES